MKRRTDDKKGDRHENHENHQGEKSDKKPDTVSRREISFAGIPRRGKRVNGNKFNAYSGRPMLITKLVTV